jgi:hypothetical protein
VVVAELANPSGNCRNRHRQAAAHQDPGKLGELAGH